MDDLAFAEWSKAGHKFGSATSGSEEVRKCAQLLNCRRDSSDACNGLPPQTDAIHQVSCICPKPERRIHYIAIDFDKRRYSLGPTAAERDVRPFSRRTLLSC